jgi:hypothetical protein
MSAKSENLWPVKAVLGIAKSRTGPNLANMVDGPISLSIFWPKTPGQRARHEQGYCHDARSKHQSKVQVFSDEQPHVTLPIFPNNNTGSLFDLVQEAESELFFICPVSFRTSSSSPSSTSSRPSLKLLCHSKTLDFFTASAP